MATEAQRLMMVSLGKIQGCRQQRGGINLYKSLLVTKVLYRARSVALTENAVHKKEEEASEDQRVPEVAMQEETHVNTPVESEHEVATPNNTDTIKGHNYDFDSQDKENVKPMNNSRKPQNYPVNGPEDFADSEDSKNQTIDKCSRCVKRRLTEVEEAVESISPKKQRLEVHVYDKDSAHEPMQVEQISSLVNRFSSGFTGLLASDTDNSTQHEESAEVQGHSESSSLFSCSTHIKESFELLARPIALSV